MMFTVRPASEEDTQRIRALLASANLPLDGIDSGTAEFVVAECDGDVVGTAALEWHADDALLRSVVVDPVRRGARLGSRLVDTLIQKASERGSARVVLLTETASGFFARKGFVTSDRSLIRNRTLLESPEFAHACANSAAFMVLDLLPSPRSADMSQEKH